MKDPAIIALEALGHARVPNSRCTARYKDTPPTGDGPRNPPVWCDLMAGHEGPHRHCTGHRYNIMSREHLIEMKPLPDLCQKCGTRWPCKDAEAVMNAFPVLVQQSLPRLLEEGRVEVRLSSDGGTHVFEESGIDRLLDHLTQAKLLLNPEQAERGLVCMFCGEGFGYAGQKPDEATLRAAVQHEKHCPKNPYKAEVERLALSAADSQRQADLLLEKLHAVETERNRYKAALEWIVNNSTDEEPFAAATRALAEAVRP